MHNLTKTLVFFSCVIFSTACCALTITSDDNGQVTLPNNQLTIGSMAPPVTLTTGDYKKKTIGGATGKVQIISTIESFNTSVCDEQTMLINKAAKQLKNVTISIVTTNQPFIVDAFQKQHKINNINVLSAFNDPSFGMNYGVQVIGGQLTGITARAVFVVNKQGKIIYKEITNNIDHALNLKAATLAAKKADAE